MKKTIVLCLLILSVIGVMAACGKDAKNTTPTATPTEAAPTEAPTETPTPTPSPVPDVSLKDVFSAHGLKVGTCLTTTMTDNAAYSKLITQQFTSVTMENDMKPDYLFNQDKSKAAGDLVVEFNPNMKKMLDWAKENGMAVRGHTLVWYSQTPQWIFHEDFDEAKPFVTREVMLKRMESYIKQVFEKLKEEGYIDLIYAYDVVNEAWMEDGSMRSAMNPWYSVIGEDYIWHAFNFANKYAPASIDLYYNDYNEQYKTDTLEKFVKTLVDENGNYLIDGIGFQAHLYTQDSLTDYFKTVDQLSKLGLKIQLTELDICLGKYQMPKQPNAKNLAAQGVFYYDLINGLFERIDAGTLKMDALTFWGFADGMSWRKGYSPLLFNQNYQKKPAFWGAVQVRDLAGFDYKEEDK